MRSPLAICLLILCSGSPLRSSEPDRERLEFFESKIRPVFSKYCYACHSEEAQKAGKLKAGLFLDRQAGLLQGGESGPVLVRNQPNQSLLIQTLKHADGVPAMPPTGALPPSVIQDIERWIADGAIDPRNQPQINHSKAMTLEQAKTHWAYQPIRKPSIPQVASVEWNTTAIDRLVSLQHAKRNLKPVKATDARQLVRRLSFDLTGLPATPEQIQAFEKNPTLEAYEELVDDYLSSWTFGERWARHWLDIARYAESNGKDHNIIWHDAWRYRDYVIESYFRDKPINQFIREQIAGDLLPFVTKSKRDEQRIATGFLALGPKAFEEKKADVFRMDLIDEQIDVIGRSILGLSIACARCHDHKFDAISSKDYYALAGIFRSTKTLYGYGHRGVANVQHSELQPIGKTADADGPDAIEFMKKLNDSQVELFEARGKLIELLKQESAHKEQVEKLGASLQNNDQALVRFRSEQKSLESKITEILEKQKELVQSTPRMPGFAMAARDFKQPEDCRLHIRGEVTNLGAVIPRGVLSAIPNVPQPKMPTNASGRLELANWLVHDENPLTARVYVNRVWQQLFGQALVTTPDDFGANGARPSHPELLDYLARTFIDSGWSTKKLIREIVLTRAYRASETANDANERIDPENTFLWRMSPRPLDAEAARDAMLFVTGQLQAGAPKQSAMSQLNTLRDWEHFGHEPLFTPQKFEHDHRSIYLNVIRAVPAEFMQLFDGADPSHPVPKRAHSFLPAKALFLKNSPWMIEQAKRLAERVDTEVQTEDDRIDRAFRLTYGRAADKLERKRIRDFLNAPSPSVGTPDRLTRWITVCQSLLASSEFLMRP